MECTISEAGTSATGYREKESERESERAKACLTIEKMDL